MTGVLDKKVAIKDKLSYPDFGLKEKRWFVLFLAVLFSTMALASNGSSLLDSDNFPVSRDTGASIASIQSSDLSSPSSEGSHCSDACHLGFCHIGHCAFPSTSPVHLSFPLIEMKLSPSDPLAFEAPSLDGLRRPPRLS